MIICYKLDNFIAKAFFLIANSLKLSCRSVHNLRPFKNLTYRKEEESDKRGKTWKIRSS